MPRSQRRFTLWRRQEFCYEVLLGFACTKGVIAIFLYGKG